MNSAVKNQYEAWRKKRIRKFLIRLTLAILALLVVISFGINMALEMREPTSTDQGTTSINNYPAPPPIPSQALLLEQFTNMQNELEIKLTELVTQTAGHIGISYYCLTTSR